MFHWSMWILSVMNNIVTDPVEGRGEKGGGLLNCKHEKGRIFVLLWFCGHNKKLWSQRRMKYWGSPLYDLPLEQTGLLCCLRQWKVMLSLLSIKRLVVMVSWTSWTLLADNVGYWVVKGEFLEKPHCWLRGDLAWLCNLTTGGINSFAASEDT